MRAAELLAWQKDKIVREQRALEQQKEEQQKQLEERERERERKRDRVVGRVALLVVKSDPLTAILKRRPIRALNGSIGPNGTVITTLPPCCYSFDINLQLSQCGLLVKGSSPLSLQCFLLRPPRRELSFKKRTLNGTVSNGLLNGRSERLSCQARYHSGFILLLIEHAENATALCPSSTALPLPVHTHWRSKLTRGTERDENGEEEDENESSMGSLLSARVDLRGLERDMRYQLLSLVHSSLVGETRREIDDEDETTRERNDEDEELGMYISIPLIQYIDGSGSR